MRGVNRTIIIPRGTLNSDDINVVVVPRSLQNTTQPLIVRPAAGKKLAALSLPIWGDELDSSPTGKARYERDLQPPEDDFEFPDDSDLLDFETSVRCASSPEGSPHLVHVSSKTVSITNDGPPEMFEVTFDASDGVDANVFETVVEQGVKEESSYRAFDPSETSSFDEMTFNPILSSTLAGDYGPMADQGMYYSAVRSSPPSRSAYQPTAGCGSCSGKGNISRESVYGLLNENVYEKAPRQYERSSGRRRGKRAPRKSGGCGSGCC